jgi:hypothetical protein
VTWLADLLADHWLDLFGWAGSALLIVSLLQARVLRFRLLNLVAGLMLVLFNAMIMVWPMVAMNLATGTTTRHTRCWRCGPTTRTSTTS